MNLSEYIGSPIPAMIYKYHEANTSDWRRPHLGASIIGRKCAREVWYSFHWCKAPSFDGRMLRLFETGQLAEDRIVKELEGIGIEVYGQQKVISILPHFGGSCDGIGKGFPESRAPHVLEFKTHNRKSFETLQSKGVQESKPEHYVQMQIYMGGLGLDRAYYIAVNKDTDEIYAERVRFDKELFTGYVGKARMIIDAQTVKDFPKIADNPARFECRFCNYKNMCHGRDVPEVNCRTCLHSTAAPDGTWTCARHGGAIPVDFQREACEDHLFIPDILGMEVTGAGDDWVSYENGWTNKNNSRCLTTSDFNPRQLI